MTEKEFKELKVGDKVRIISMPIQYCAYGKGPPAKKSKVKEVKRRAKGGEYIKIVNKSAFCVSYENGEIFKVECITPLGSAVVDLGNSFHMLMHEEEYVVLEGYKPKK